MSARPPQSQRAQAPSLTGSHPWPTTVQHLTPQKLHGQKKPSGHRQAGEFNALHVEVMSCLGELILHQYCHGDNRQVMTSQLKSSSITNCRIFYFVSWQWRKSYQICVTAWAVGEKVNPSVMWQIFISDWVTPNPYTATPDEQGKDFPLSVWLPGLSHNVCI